MKQNKKKARETLSTMAIQATVCMKFMAKGLAGPGVLWGMNSAYLNAFLCPTHVYMHLDTLRELSVRKGPLAPVGSGFGERGKPFPLLLSHSAPL